jgi:hypothetical protein
MLIATSIQSMKQPATILWPAASALLIECMNSSNQGA